MGSVFISYAREDDDDFVERLYKFLHLKFDVWWDKVSMPNRSLTFVEEIRHAIHIHERLIVVIGPRALHSDYVRAEWQSAQAEGKPVIPLIRHIPRETQQPHDCLPAELRSFHALTVFPSEDEEVALESLFRILMDPIPATPPVYGDVPELPPHYRPRQEEYSKVFDAVLGELKSPRVDEGSNRVTVLSGMGGIGKTVLVSALVRAIRGRPSTFFSDGVYWLSKEPLAQLSKLTGVTGPDVLSLLIDYFAERRFMLVVDDPPPEILKSLSRILSGSGRMIVMTRRGEISANYRSIRMGLLTKEEAISFVADWVECKESELSPDALEVIKLCGRHPLALAINAANAKLGLSWSSIARALNQGELEFAKHKFDEYAYETVHASIQISLDTLEEGHPQARQCYQQLSSFIWSNGVPVAAIARIWKFMAGLEFHFAEQLLVFLENRHLLQFSGEGVSRLVHLHDLHRAFIVDTENPEPNEVLLKAYRPDAVIQSSPTWWKVVDDGYIREHLFEHLVRGQNQKEVCSLLSAESNDENVWFAMRLADDDLNGYIKDVRRARDAWQTCLYSLIHSSHRALGLALPPQLLASYVSNGLWSVQRGLAHARLSPELVERTSRMIALLPMAPDRDQWLQDVINQFEELNIEDQSDLASEFASKLEVTEMLMLLSRLLADNQNRSSTRDEQKFARMLATISSQVPPTSASEVLHILGRYGEGSRLIFSLPKSEMWDRIHPLLEEARETGGTVGSAVFAVRVSDAVEHLDHSHAESLISEAFELVSSKSEGRLRIRSLMHLLPHLPLNDQEKIIEEFATFIKRGSVNGIPVFTLPNSLQSKLRIAIEDGKLWQRKIAIGYFDGLHREQFMNSILAEMEDNAPHRAPAFIDELASQMTTSQQLKAFSLATKHLVGWERAKALISLAKAFPNTSRGEVISEALTAINALDEPQYRIRMLNLIAPLLYGRHLKQSLRVAQKIGEPSGIGQLACLLGGISSSKCGELVDLISRWAINRNDDWEKIKMLRVIPDYAPSKAYESLLPVARAASECESRAACLIAISKGISRERQWEILEEALWESNQSEFGQCNLDVQWHLAELMSERYPDLVSDVLEHLESMRNRISSSAYTEVASHLLPLMKDDSRERLLRHTLELDKLCGGDLDALISHVRPDVVRGALLELIHPSDRVEAWLELRAKVDPESPILDVESGHEPLVASTLAKRMAELEGVAPTLNLLDNARLDIVTLSAFASISSRLDLDRLHYILDKVEEIRFESVFVPFENGPGHNSMDARYYLRSLLAPAFAAHGEIGLAYSLVNNSKSESRPVVWLSVAKAMPGEEHDEALLFALRSFLDDTRPIDRRYYRKAISEALSSAPNLAEHAWDSLLDWSGNTIREEAISTLAAFWPVAKLVGGTELVDELYLSANRVLRWWP